MNEQLGTDIGDTSGNTDTVSQWGVIYIDLLRLTDYKEIVAVEVLSQKGQVLLARADLASYVITKNGGVNWEAISPEQAQREREYYSQKQD